MKTTKILYWTFTGLFAGFMLISAIPDIIKVPEAVEFINSVLGYPVYLVPFIGVAKALGAIAILIPGLVRLKEWAYAGLFFDLAGATYSILAIGGGVSQWIFMVLPFTIFFLSYIYWHKLLKQNV